MSNTTLMQMTVGPGEASPLQIAQVRDFRPKGNKQQEGINHQKRSYLQIVSPIVKANTFKEDEELNKEI
jgi:hypothetical protein